MPLNIEDLRDLLEQQGLTIVPLKSYEDREGLVEAASKCLHDLRGLPLKQKRAALRLALKWLGEQSRIGRDRDNAADGAEDAQPDSAKGSDR